MVFWLHYLPEGCNHSIGNTSLTSRTRWRRWSAAPLTSRCVRRLQLSPHQRGRRSGPAESTPHREQLGGSERDSRVERCGRTLMKTESFICNSAFFIHPDGCRLQITTPSGIWVWRPFHWFIFLHHKIIFIFNLRWKKKKTGKMCSVGSGQVEKRADLMEAIQHGW